MIPGRGEGEGDRAYIMWVRPKGRIRPQSSVGRMFRGDMGSDETGRRIGNTPHQVQSPGEKISLSRMGR